MSMAIAAALAQRLWEPRVLFHRVQPAETLWDIAVRYGVSLHQLIAWNIRVDPVRPRPGALVRVPLFRARRVQSHVVQPGETLWLIGQRYGVDPWTIARWSGIYTPDQIFPGQVVRIPLPA